MTFLNWHNINVYSALILGVRINCMKSLNYLENRIKNLVAGRNERVYPLPLSALWAANRASRLEEKPM